MSPRSYSSEKRQAAAAATRTRMLDAARAILSGRGVPQLTVDTVARESGVARQTVYNAFGSKAGLLEALCDHLAERGRLPQLGEAFTRADPADALAGFVAAFCRFWTADRTAVRRLRGLAAIDADLASVIRARDERRKEGVAALLARFPHGDGTDDGRADVLWTLTSFETFDVLATPERSVDDVADLVTASALAIAVRTGEAPYAAGGGTSST